MSSPNPPLKDYWRDVWKRLEKSDESEDLDEAVERLTMGNKPPADNQQKAKLRAEICKMIRTVYRNRLYDDPALSRARLKKLAKRATEAAELLSHLTPTAKKLVFKNKKVQKHFKGLGEFNIRRLLESLSSRCETAVHAVPHLHGGRPVDDKKYKLVARCLEIFDRERPGEATQKEGDDFSIFATCVFIFVGGNSNDSLSRQIRAAFKGKVKKYTLAHVAICT